MRNKLTKTQDMGVTIGFQAAGWECKGPKTGDWEPGDDSKRVILQGPGATTRIPGFAITATGAHDRILGRGQTWPVCSRKMALAAVREVEERGFRMVAGEDSKTPGKSRQGRD